MGWPRELAGELALQVAVCAAGLALAVVVRLLTPWLWLIIGPVAVYGFVRGTWAVRCSATST